MFARRRQVQPDVGRCANGRTPDLETKTALKENATRCSTERSGDDRHRREKI